MQTTQSFSFLSSFFFFISSTSSLLFLSRVYGVFWVTIALSVSIWFHFFSDRLWAEVLRQREYGYIMLFHIWRHRNYGKKMGGYIAFETWAENQRSYCYSRVHIYFAIIILLLSIGEGFLSRLANRRFYYCVFIYSIEQNLFLDFSMLQVTWVD